MAMPIHVHTFLTAHIAMTYLAEEDVKNVKDKKQRELGGEEREEPL